MEAFGSGMMGLYSNSYTEAHCLGLNLAPARNHSIPRSEAQEHTHAFIHKCMCGGWGGGTAAADGETILAMFKHGSHTRQHALTPMQDF